MLGDWIKAERDRRGWSQRQLAELAGVTQGAISHLEVGARRTAPTVDLIRGVAAAFGLTVDEMLQAAGLGDGPGLNGDAAELVALLNEGGVSEPERLEYLALMQQLPQDKRREAINHLRWLLSEHKAEQVRQAEAAQRRARRRESARHSDFQEETQQRARSGC